MSQEERDRRLGLSGLSPTLRAQRIAELERDLNERFTRARAKLQEERAARSARQQAEQTAEGSTDQT